MNFIKNMFGFHADVLKKIRLNKLFFLFAAAMYLVSDFIVYLQPIMSGYFANPDDMSFSSIFIKWALFGAIWLAYFVSASLFSVYFVRKDKNVSKLRAYLKPLVNMRVYGAYFFMVFGLLFSVFLSTKFLPAITDFLGEGLKILVNPAIESDKKFSAWLASPLFTLAIENTAAWQWFMAVVSFIGVIITVAMGFVFALPLVVKSKSNTLIASFKKSFNGAKSNFALFLFTIVFMVLLKYLIPSSLDMILPESFTNMLINNNIHYATRPIVSLYDAFLFFYVIIGLEKFVLTNDKK